MNFIIPLILILIVLNILALRKMNRSQFEILTNQENVLTLKVHTMYKYLGNLLIFISPFVLIIPLIKFGFDLRSFLIGSFVFLILLITGLSVLLFQKNHRVEMEKDYLMVYDMFNRKNKVRWSSINAIKLNLLINMYVIKTDNKNYCLSQHLIGILAIFSFAKDIGILNLPNDNSMD